MAQSALTVTTPSPTPPTNMAFTGRTARTRRIIQRNTYTKPFGMTPGTAGRTEPAAMVR